MYSGRLERAFFIVHNLGVTSVLLYRDCVTKETLCLCLCSLLIKYTQTILTTAEWCKALGFCGGKVCLATQCLILYVLCRYYEPWSSYRRWRSNLGSSWKCHCNLPCGDTHCCTTVVDKEVMMHLYSTHSMRKRHCSWVTVSELSYIVARMSYLEQHCLHIYKLLC